MSKRFLAIFSSLALLMGFATPAQASNQPGLVPTFGTVRSIAGGYEVQITNYDPNYLYTAIASDCAVATVTGDWLKVTSVLPNQTVRARVITARSGYDDASATVNGTTNSMSGIGVVENYNSYAAYYGHVVGPDGTLYVAWADSGTRANLSKSADGGASWTPLKTWTLQNAAPQIGVGVAVDSDGDLAMVWQEGPHSSYKVMVSTSTDDGVTWSNPSQINTGEATQLTQIKFSPDGDLIVSWNLYNGSNFVAPYRVSTDLGATWSAKVNASSLPEPSYYPFLSELSNGEVVMGWSNGSNIRAAKFNDATNTFSASAATNITSLADYNVSTDGQNNLVAVWTQGAAANSRDVAYATFDGATWSTPVTASAAPGSYSSPTISKDASSVVVTWRDGTTAAKVRATTSLSPVTWGNEVSLAGATADLYQLKGLNYGTGKFAVTWLTKDSTTNNYRLELVNSTDGGATWSQLQTVAGASEANYQPILLSNNLGSLAVLWRIQYSNNMSLKTALVNPSGSDPRTIYQVAEINAGGSTSHAFAYDFAVLNGKLYTISRNDATGFELFEYDGTQVRLVEDLWPGSGNGVYDTTFVAKTSSEIYFQGTDGQTGYELYKFDGTAITLVADLNPTVITPGDQAGNLIFSASTPSSGIIHGGKLFFASNYPSAVTGYVLDLTTPGAVPVRLSNYFTGWTTTGFYSPVRIGPNLYFRAGSSSTGAIYETDGTATPVMVPGTQGTYPSTLSVYGSKLVFGGSPTPSVSADLELFSWDAANPSAPASLVSNINTYNTGGERGSSPNGFVIRCNELFFVASSGFATGNREMWKWDGYEVSQAKDFWPGSSSTNSGLPGSFRVVGNDIYLFANDGVNGTEPWVFRGSEASLLQNFGAGSSGSVIGSPLIFDWNGQIYMPLLGPTGIELYAYGVPPVGHQVATYTPTFTITYDPNTGTGSATATHPSGTVTLNAGSGFTKAGKVLLGWDTSSTATTATYAPSASYTLSGNVTLYAVWGDIPATPSSEPAPTLSLPSGPVSGSSGGDVEFKGSGLGSVTKAEIGEKDAPIKSKTDSSIKVGVPKLNAGLYDLKLTAGFGQITIQGAVKVVGGSTSITDEALSKIAAWTKLNSSKTKVSIFAKEPVGLGKFEFLHNGKVIRWARAVDASDPKLTLRSEARYLLRTQALVKGQNRFEVRVDGKRVWFASYRKK